MDSGTDIDILACMADYMTGFKSLLDTCSPEDMDGLCAHYEGFIRYARTLEDIAQGIQDGNIRVP